MIRIRYILLICIVSIVLLLALQWQRTPSFARGEPSNAWLDLLRRQSVRQKEHPNTPQTIIVYYKANDAPIITGTPGELGDDFFCVNETSSGQTVCSPINEIAAIRFLVIGA